MHHFSSNVHSITCLLSHHYFVPQAVQPRSLWFAWMAKQSQYVCTALKAPWKPKQSLLTFSLNKLLFFS